MNFQKLKQCIVKTIFFVGILISHNTTIVAASDGDLDVTFNSLGTLPGTVSTPIPGYTIAQARGVYIQSDGKIVAVGYDEGANRTTFATARYNTDGSLDATYGTAGIQLTDLSAAGLPTVGFVNAYGVAVQSDGKIVVTGEVRTGGNDQAFIARLLANGALDITGFNASSGNPGVYVFAQFNTGSPLEEGNAVVIDVNSSIVMVGTSQVSGNTSSGIIVGRLTSAGVLDTSFNGSGRLLISSGPTTYDQGLAVALQADGQSIIAAGSSSVGSTTLSANFAFVQISPSGTITNPLQTTNFGSEPSICNAVVVQPNGYIVFVGQVLWTDSNTYFALARYVTNGSGIATGLDPAFVGSSPEFSTTPGTIAAPALGGGGANPEISIATSAAIQTDGKIIAGGYTTGGSDSSFTAIEFSVARFLPADGSLDTTFGPGGDSSTPGFVLTSFGDAGDQDQIFATALQGNGYIVCAGTTYTASASAADFALARYVVNGEPLVTTTINVASIVGNAITFTGNAQNPSIVDVFIDPLVGSTVTVGTGSTGTWSFTATGYTGGIAQAFARYRDDGHVNLASATAAFTACASGPFASNNGFTFCTGPASFTGNLAPLVTGGLPPYAFSSTGATVGGTATVGSSGPFTFTVTPGFSGVGGFVYAVSDSVGCDATAAISLAISDISAGSTAIAQCSDTPVTGSLSTFATSAFGPLVFGLTGTPIGGTAVVSPTGLYDFTPTPGFTGPGGFVYQITDANACVATGAVTVDVGGLSAGSTGFHLCSGPAAVTGNLLTLVTGGFPPYTFGPGGSPIGGGVNFFGGTGPFLFSPNSGFSSGVGGFPYEVTDSLGCTAAGDVTIDISSIVAGSTAILDCSSVPVTGNLNSLISFSAFPISSFSATGAPLGGSVVVNPSGPFTFTPATGFNGLGGFVYQATDSNTCSATGAVDITIGGPSAGSTGVITCNTSLTGNLANLVTGGSGPFSFSGPLDVSCDSSVTISPSGIFSYTAPAGFTAPCTFVYEVTDSNTCASTGAVTVTANTAPVASNATFSTCFTTPVVGSLAALVDFGVPPLSFTIVNGASNGSVTVNPSTGVFTYTANVGFLGTDTFTYQMADSSTPPCISNVGTITINVTTSCCPTITDPFFLLIQQLYFGR